MKIFYSYRFLVPAALLVGLAPFSPEPHLTTRIRMFTNGTLSHNLDILDFIWHAWSPVLLGFRLGRDIGKKLVTGKVTGMEP